MPVRETLEFDLRNALRQVDQLEGMIEDLGRTVTLDLDIRGDASREIQSIDDRMDDIIVSAQALSRELGETEGAADQAAGDFSRMATEIGTAETKASDLAREILEADRAAGRLDTEAGEVAAALGRSERQAAGLAGELREADRAAERLDRNTDGLAGKLKGGALVIGAGVVLGLKGANDAIQSFAILEDSINAVNVIFGEAAESVLAFGDQAAESAGLSETAFNQAVVPIGALLQNFGFDAKEAGDAAVILVQRAADLASVVGGEVPTALAALSSALRGEADPLEAYGASISAARVEQFALANELARTKDEITPAITLQARYGLILQDTAKVAGDYAATAGDLANAQRTAGAKAQEFGTVLGEALAPALESLLGLVDPLLEGIRQLVPGFSNAADSAGAFFDEIGEGETRFRETFATAGAGIGILGEGFASFVDSIQVQAAQILLDTDQVADQLQQIEDRQARIKVKGVGVQLAKDLDAGTKPVLAFANAVSSVARQTENIDGFGLAYRNFATQANLSKDELIEVTRFMLDNAVQAGASADEIAFLRLQYALLTDDITPNIEALNELHRVQREAANLPPIFPDATKFTTFSTDVDLAAKNAAEDLKALADVAAAQAERAADAFDLFADQPEKLTESFNEGVQALRQAVLAQQTFDINLALLHSFGLDALADDFARIGVAGIDQLIEAVNLAVTDLPAAIEADRLTQGFTGIADDAFDALVAQFVKAGISPSDAARIAKNVISPEVIAALDAAAVQVGNRTAVGTISEYREALIEEAEQMETARIQAAINARVEESFTADDQAEYAATATVTAWEAEAIRAAEALSGATLQARLGDLFSDINFVISADQFQFPTSFSGAMDLLLHPTATVGGTSTMMQGGGVTIYQTFTGEIRDLDTQLAQANQSTSAVANLFNRVQS